MNDFQRTDEWYLARKGMLTASEIVNILVKGRGKDEVFGKTALTYLNEKVAERFMEDEMFIYYMTDVKKSSPAMRWGTEYEDTARQQYEIYTKRRVMDCPFTPLKGYEDYVGGSPDGRLSTLDGIIEIKCPYNPAVHLEHTTWDTPEKLKAGNLTYYSQVCLNMMITGAKYCDFISYSPMFRHGLDLSILRIPADEEFQALLLERLDLAVSYMKNQIAEISKLQTNED
jgi:exodeoxyribonuclease (lambda-induced)